MTPGRCEVAALMLVNKTTKAARDRFYAERRRKIEQVRAAVKARPGI